MNAWKLFNIACLLFVVIILLICIFYLPCINPGSSCFGKKMLIENCEFSRFSCKNFVVSDKADSSVLMELTNKHGDITLIGGSAVTSAINKPCKIAIDNNNIALDNDDPISVEWKTGETKTFVVGCEEGLVSGTRASFTFNLSYSDRGKQDSTIGYIHSATVNNRIIE
jgi:hypothetical protein